MSAQIPTLLEFLAGVISTGPAVGVLADNSATPPARRVAAHVSADYQVRAIAGAALQTRDDIYSEFARVWRFPAHFGHNADAFDECMRDLDQPRVDTASSSPTGFLTVITDAQHMLRGADSTFGWFAESVEFYRDHYRDIADPPAAFAVILSSPAATRAQVINRWVRAGQRPALITT